MRGNHSYLTAILCKTVADIIEKLPYWPDFNSQVNAISALREPGIYGPGTLWYRKLMKLIIKNIEMQQGELSDDVVAFVVELYSNGISAESCVSYLSFDTGTCIRAISTDSEHIITDRKKEQKVVVRVQPSHNQLGMRMWGASLFLAELLLQNNFLLERRKIIELGSGVGNLGLILNSGLKNFKTFIMTDFTDEVLDNLRSNVTLNCGLGHDISRLRVCKLDWALEPLAQLQRAHVQLRDTESHAAVISTSPTSCGHDESDDKYSPDVILAADCVYSPDLTELLVNSVVALLARTPSHSHRPFQAEESHAQPALAPDTVAGLALGSELPARTHQHPPEPATPPNLCTSTGTPSDPIAWPTPVAIFTVTVRDPDTYTHFVSYLRTAVGDSGAPLVAEDATQWALSSSGPQLFYYPGRADMRMWCVHTAHTGVGAGGVLNH